jgi:predicted metal-dependent peptidase
MGSGTDVITGDALVVLDRSGSMAGTNDSRRSIDLAGEMLSRLLIECPNVRIIAFGSTVEELTGLEPGPGLRLPEPGGSTALHLAFDCIAASKRPGRIVVITDGMPDDAEAALIAARRLGLYESEQ